MRQESPFLLTAVLSSVHTALPVKSIQEWRRFFNMRFRFVYGSDTRTERENNLLWKKKKSDVGVCPLLFPALYPFLSENHYQ